MYEATKNLVRRAVEAGGEDQNLEDVLNRFHYDVNGKAMFFLAATFISFVIGWSLISYSLNHVIASLTMVESPSYHYQIHEEKETPNHADALAEEVIDAEISISKTPHITSSIKRTRKQLKARAGRLAPYRGLALYCVYHVLNKLVFNFLGGFFMGHARWSLSGIFISVLAAVVTDVLFARLSTTWVHIIISEPSDKPWYKRLAPRNTWAKVWKAVAISSLALQLSQHLPMLLFGYSMVDNDATNRVVGRSLACGMIGLVCFLGLYIPATVALTRVQASLLPEDQETVVPFDRTFNGRVVPEVVGGTGAVGFADAWKSFDKPSRLRLIKLYVKIFFIQIAMYMTVATLFMFELATFHEIGWIKKAEKGSGQ